MRRVRHSPSGNNRQDRTSAASQSSRSLGHTYHLKLPVSRREISGEFEQHQTSHSRQGCSRHREHHRTETSQLTRTGECYLNNIVFNIVSGVRSAHKQNLPVNPRLDALFCSVPQSEQEGSSPGATGLGRCGAGVSPAAPGRPRRWFWTIWCARDATAPSPRRGKCHIAMIILGP
jgi:hypothetical protein